MMGAFHGGPFVEVFSAQGSKSEGSVKKTGAVKKVFDKTAKGWVFELEGGRDVKMQLPPDGKDSLGLLQNYLVLQVHVPIGKGFSIELAILDQSKTRRRLNLSCNNKDLHVTPLHVRAPLNVVRRGVWLNLCLDVAGIFNETFGPVTRLAEFWSIESILLSAACKVRKIFTVRQALQDSSPDGLEYGDIGLERWLEEVVECPATLDFPAGVDYCTQLVHMAKLKHLLQIEARERDVGGGAVSPRRGGNVVLDGGGGGAGAHIAFGKRVGAWPPGGGGGGLSASGVSPTPRATLDPSHASHLSHTAPATSYKVRVGMVGPGITRAALTAPGGGMSRGSGVGSAPTPTSPREHIPAFSKTSRLTACAAAGRPDQTPPASTRPDHTGRFCRGDESVCRGDESVGLEASRPQHMNAASPLAHTSGGGASVRHIHREEALAHTSGGAASVRRRSSLAGRPASFSLKDKHNKPCRTCATPHLGECECGSSTRWCSYNGEEGGDDKRDNCRHNTLSTPSTPVRPPYPEEGVSRYGGEPASPNLTPLKALQQKRLPRAQAVATHTATPHRAPAPPLGDGGGGGGGGAAYRTAAGRDLEDDTQLPRHNDTATAAEKEKEKEKAKRDAPGKRSVKSKADIGSGGGSGSGSGSGRIACFSPSRQGSGNGSGVGSFAASRLLHAQRKEAQTLLKHQLEPAARPGARPAASSPHPPPSQGAAPISHSHMSLTHSGNGRDVGAGDDEDVGAGDDDVRAGDDDVGASHPTHHASQIAEHLTARYAGDGRERERERGGTLASEKIGWSLEDGRRGGAVMRSFETLSVEVPVTPGFVAEHANGFMPPPRSIERASDQRESRERESRERESRERESIESMWRPSASRESLQSDAAEVEEEVVVEDGMGGGGWGSDDSDSVYHLSPRTPASPGGKQEACGSTHGTTYESRKYEDSSEAGAVKVYTHTSMPRPILAKGMMPAAAPPHHPHPHQHPQARTHYPSSPPDALLAKAGGNSAAGAQAGYKAIELDAISGRDSFKAPSDRSDYDYDTNSAANSPNKSRLASISPNKHLDLHLGTVTAAALAAVADAVDGVDADAERGEANPNSRHARHAHAQAEAAVTFADFVESDGSECGSRDRVRQWTMLHSRHALDMGKSDVEDADAETLREAGEAGGYGLLASAARGGDAYGQSASGSPNSRKHKQSMLERLTTPPIIAPSQIDRLILASPLPNSGFFFKNGSNGMGMADGGGGGGVCGAALPPLSSPNRTLYNVSEHMGPGFEDDLPYQQHLRPPTVDFPRDQEEEEDLELIYDPILNCYWDPQNNKYYELKNPL